MLLPDAFPFLFIAFFGLAAVPNSQTVRRTCGLVLVTYHAYILFRPHAPDAPRFPIYQTALWLSIMLLGYSDHAILNDAYFIHKHRGQRGALTEMPFLQRLWWSVHIMFNQRGVNWSWEIPHLRRSTLTRWSFVGYQLIRLLVCVVISDVLRYLRAKSPGWQVDSGEGFGSRGFIWQTYNVMLWWATVMATQIFMYSSLSVVTVTLGVYEPGDWPSYYGTWDSPKSIRMFWGRTWHQLLRRPLTAHGKFITHNILGLDRNNDISPYIQLYIAFFLSGLCHGAGDWAATKTFQNSRNTFVYYMLQAVIITVEDGLIALGKRIGVYRIPVVINYAWVIFWMGLLSPIWIEGMVKAGINVDPPFSLFSLS
ncbi:hypothetical protein P691DRAFT_778922 [Macrolepiota fuliginosa MF-IS2]|uniref:Wax synthase domain-containing protein n=1 Tax=Macrolepiota fuliginosa MF-IS2 TaxID=1400762 RepID=A0A9P5X3H8_9AGAR|nr:hypothetical protein P691DRAFT_778922 [Macrolepiota fuliginosa MF-IS2]